ncbi:hypothetical protein BH23GEM9_BH23GEM9_15580 [soil metagenome]
MTCCGPGVEGGRTARLRGFMTAPGRGAVVLAGAALALSCGDARGPVDPRPGRDFAASGRVHVLSGSVPAGLRVTVRSGDDVSSTAVAQNGSFQIVARVLGDSVDVIIDTEGTPRQTVPVLLRVPSGTSLSGANVVLVPLKWTVRAGSYSGQTIDVSVDAAFRPPCTRSGDTNCDGFYPRAWFTGIKLWRSVLPAPVAFDHARTHQGISAADSAAFWAIVERMHVDAGVTLFRPVRNTDIAVNAQNEPVNGILVRIDTTLTGFGAFTNWWWNANGEMYAALVRPRTRALMLNGALLSHELLHTQGFKHSCSWPTVMYGYATPCPASPVLSAQDVAYAEIARAVSDAQRANGAAHGLVAALQGERGLMLGLPPYVPAGGIPLRLLRGDSIGDRIGDGDHAH